MSEPVVLDAGSTDADAPVALLLHGRGSNERDIINLAVHLPAEFSYYAIRGGVSVGPNAYAWFENRGIGRPTPDSLRHELDWFRSWLDPLVGHGRPVIPIGFSGGAAFAGGLILDAPDRFAGGAVLYGTLPFDAGVLTTPGRLEGLPVFHAVGQLDNVIPAELLALSYEYLAGPSGATLTYCSTQVGHMIDPMIIPDFSEWMLDTALVK
jgi:phospholipase/carboxylesterase